jgi:hypothetical protein
MMFHQAVEKWLSYYLFCVSYLDWGMKKRRVYLLLKISVLKVLGQAVGILMNIVVRPADASRTGVTPFYFFSFGIGSIGDLSVWIYAKDIGKYKIEAAIISS